MVASLEVELWMLKVMYLYCWGVVDKMCLLGQRDVLLCWCLVERVGYWCVCVCDVNSAFVRLLAAAMMIWSLVSVGIHILYGNHFTASHIRVDDVVGVQMVWQR